MNSIDIRFESLDVPLEGLAAVDTFEGRIEDAITLHVRTHKDARRPDYWIQFAGALGIFVGWRPRSGRPEFPSVPGVYRVLHSPLCDIPGCSHFAVVSETNDVSIVGPNDPEYLELTEED